MIYGKHLTLLLSNIENIENVNSHEEIKNFLTELVHSIKMRILVPAVSGFEDGDNEHVGYSGVVILCESHCAIHVYSGLNKLFLDIFSCKDYETQKVLEFIKSKIGNFTIEEYKEFNRGIHWSNDIKKEAKQWQDKR